MFVGLVAMPLILPAAYHDGVAIQVCDLAADHDDLGGGYQLSCCDSIGPVPSILRHCNTGIFAILNKLGVLIALTWFDIVSCHRPPCTLLFD